MIEKTFTYEDYNGNSVTEKVCFNLTKADAIRLSGLQGKASKIKDGAVKGTIDEDEAINDMFDMIDKVIKLSIGKRSEDGRRFVRDAEFAKEFFETPMYDMLLEELLTDKRKMAEFFTKASGSNVSVDEVVAEIDKEENKFVEDITNK